MPRKKTTKEIIRDFKKIHGKKYDYSNVDYQGMRVKVEIICPKHGPFVTTPNSHIYQKTGCPQCKKENGISSRKTTKQFVKEAKKIHGKKYDYSLVEYKGNKQKVTLICSDHGSFQITPNSHLSHKHGCPACANIRTAKALRGKLKTTREHFIARCKKVHGDRYDYSLVDYQGSTKKVTIICKKHGPFEQKAANHSAGSGCQKCSPNRLKTNEEFISECKCVHGELYDYSMVDYRRSDENVTIICKTHGPFEQEASRHLIGQGCNKCAIEARAEKMKGSIRVSDEEIIKRARKVHGNLYEYPMEDYSGVKSKMTIVCHKHGPFEQDVSNHLNGSRCPKCASNALKSNEKFIMDCIKVHADTYDYSLVEYTGSGNSVTIICSKHGPFEQRASTHVKGGGCPSCSPTGLKTTKDFIEDAIKVHADLYDYSMVDYRGSIPKVTIICPKHGPFEQQPQVHLQGCGCPVCKFSSGEREIYKLLKSMDLEFEAQKKFDDCIHEKNLSYDFYIPEKKMLIEYNGRQHYEAIDYFGGEKALKKQQKRDQIKRTYANENGYILVEIPYHQFENIEKILRNQLQ